MLYKIKLIHIKRVLIFGLILSIGFTCCRNSNSSNVNKVGRDSLKAEKIPDGLLKYVEEAKWNYYCFALSYDEDQIILKNQTEFYFVHPALYDLFYKRYDIQDSIINIFFTRSFISKKFHCTRSSVISISIDRFSLKPIRYATHNEDNNVFTNFNSQTQSNDVLKWKEYKDVKVNMKLLYNKLPIWLKNEIEKRNVFRNQ